MIGKTLRSEICWANRGIVALQSLQVSYLSDLHSRFYESSKLKKWMCELCTFSQIRSHLLLHCFKDAFAQFYIAPEIELIILYQSSNTVICDSNAECTYALTYTEEM